MNLDAKLAEYRAALAIGAFTQREAFFAGFDHAAAGRPRINPGYPHWWLHSDWIYGFELAYGILTDREGAEHGMDGFIRAVQKVHSSPSSK